MNCEYPKNQCSMHGYLKQDIRAEHNIYFWLGTSGGVMVNKLD